MVRLPQPVDTSRFTSPARTERTASILGIALGVCFTICFATGMLSHLIQHPPAWFHYPPRPLNLYRITQGVHVFTGIASIPLLLAKVWVVYPKFWAWPPIQGIGHAVERAALLPLVGGAMFQVWSGVANIYYWYSPMPFNFTVVHYWVAWITVGGLVVHIGAKAGTARAALRAGALDVKIGTGDAHSAGAPSGDGGAPVEMRGFSRRDVLVTAGAASAVLVVGVAGETVAPLNRVSVLAPRDIAVGPQKLPVNQSAVQAGVITAALDPGYRLSVGGRVRSPLSLSLDEIRALPSRRAGLPITCVEGWSVAASWEGVPIRTLLAMAGARSGASVEVVSIEAPGRLYRSSIVNTAEAEDPDTMLAYMLNGSTLALDHGFPVRLIGPDRPGVMQTKWVQTLVVS